MPNGGARYSPVAVIAGIVALSCLALAAVLFVQGADATQRLGLFFAVIGAAVTAFVTMLKADQAATQTNGNLDSRIQAAVHRAQNARRRGDPPLTPEQVDKLTDAGLEGPAAAAGQVAPGG